jgi:hypothetical protein
MSDRQKKLTDCGCCEGQAVSTPQRIENRPGLPTISYRVGDYHHFKDSMLARLSSSELPGLQGLSTRDDDDFSIALIDAWATVSEVLSFYQEYFANEGLLRTAKERLSVLEHARLIGYQLSPGVAANTHVEFTMDEALAGVDNPVVETTIAAGVKIQSTPGPDETAQLYETGSEIVARVDWNEIRPRMTQPQLINSTMGSVVISGITTFLKPGDELLLIDQTDFKYIRKVTGLIVDDVTKTTRIKLSGNAVSPDVYSVEPLDPEGKYDDFDGMDHVSDEVIDILMIHSWAMEDIVAIAETRRWDIDEIALRINTHTDIVKNVSAGNGVYGFRKRANLFGYNATKKVTYEETSPFGPTDMAGWQEWSSVETAGELYLDNAYTEVLPESYIVLKAEKYILDRTAVGVIASLEYIDKKFRPADVFRIIGKGKVFTKSQSVYKVKAIKSLSRTEYGISGKSTQISLEDGQSWFSDLNGAVSIIRKAEVLVQSEKLALTQVPVDEKISGSDILLERADLYLRRQQYVSISGERYHQKDIISSEVLQINEVRLEHGFTRLIFTSELAHEYKRDTVTINANVALVSHGESVSEILGSGDASLASQSFGLKQTPLTYTSADTTSGVASSLELRVNNVLWHEVESFLGKGSDERIYTTKLNDEGQTTIYFGDGIEGARLPSGNNNIIARYRKGLGLGGLIKSRQLNLLLTRPLGVKDVINPLASTGADDPEKLEDARENAPLGLLTMDRAVSLQDYEDYSRSFTGIRKARAVAVSRLGVPRIYITLAGPDGALIEPSTITFKNLLNSLKNSGDPYARFSLLSYRPAYFKLDAELYIHSDYKGDIVVEAARLALREKFSFDARAFNQAVHLSEVISTLQKVKGVTAVDVNHLYRSDAGPVDPPPGSLMPGISTSGDQFKGAELLTLDPAPLDQIRVKS